MTTERRELVERIWSRDPTVWTAKDEGRWLGWLDEPARRREDVALLLTLADDVQGQFDDVVLPGTLPVRPRPRRASRRRSRAAARPCARDGGGVPARRRQPGARAGSGTRQRLAGGPRQDLLRRRERLRPVGGAAARGVDRQGGVGPDPGAGRARRRRRRAVARGAPWERAPAG